MAPDATRDAVAKYSMASAAAGSTQSAGVGNRVEESPAQSTRSEGTTISSRLTSHLYARTELRLALRRPRPILTNRLGVDSQRQRLPIKHPDVGRRRRERDIQISGGHMIAGLGACREWSAQARLVEMLHRLGTADRPLRSRIERLTPRTERAIS